MVVFKKNIWLLFAYVIIQDFDINAVGKHDEKIGIEQVKKGHLGLPTAQQPGPLVSFGQNMEDENDLQYYNYISYLSGQDKEFLTILPSLLYGIEDNFTLFIQTPVAARYVINNHKASGLQDVLAQIEYAIYNKETAESTKQITIVGNTTFPTGNLDYEHIKGFGAHAYGTQTFFAGFTASYVNYDWYPFVSAGFRYVAQDKCSKVGNQVLYQWGLCKNFGYTPNGYIASVMVEFDGTYIKKAKQAGTVDPNSGEM